MNETCTNALGRECPRPLPLRTASEERRAANLSRYVYLSKVQRQRASRCVPKRGRLLGALALGFVALALALNAFVFSGFPPSGEAPLSQAGSDSAPSDASTPRHLWARGSMPFLYQTDSEWSAQPYADGTIATHGCGPTCLAMVYVQLTGKQDMDPCRMAGFSESSGYIDSGVTSWLLMSEGAQRLGLHAQELSANVDAVRERLRAGDPIICSVGPGDFTTEGHFIVLCGLDAENRLIVRDPNSPERSQQAWDAERVLSQCRNLWAFTA